MSNIITTDLKELINKIFVSTSNFYFDRKDAYQGYLLVFILGMITGLLVI